jgi:hypothetical protein
MQLFSGTFGKSRNSRIELDAAAVQGHADQGVLPELVFGPTQLADVQDENFSLNRCSLGYTRILFRHLSKSLRTYFM